MWLTTNFCKGRHSSCRLTVATKARAAAYWKCEHVTEPWAIMITEQQKYSRPRAPPGCLFTLSCQPQLGSIYVCAAVITRVLRARACRSLARRAAVHCPLGVKFSHWQLSQWSLLFIWPLALNLSLQTSYL